MYSLFKLHKIKPGTWNELELRVGSVDFLHKNWNTKNLKDI